MRETRPYINSERAISIFPCIALIAPFVQYWFFAGCIVLGVSYDETMDVGPYSLAAAGLCVMCILHCLKSAVGDKERYRKASWICLCAAGLIGAGLAANLGAYHQYSYFPNYLVFGVMGLCAGLSLSRDDAIASATRMLDVVSAVCTLGVILFEVAQYTDSVWRTRGYAGLSYQTISYMAAIAYSFNLWSLAFARPENRFSLFNRPLFRALRVTMIPLAVIASALSGGRGGVLAIVAVSLVAIVIQVRTDRIPLKTGLFIVAVGIAALIAFFLWGDELLGFQGFKRVVTRGDNRSEVWNMALAAIGGSPFFGYGFGGYGQAFEGLYPHNIVLDLALCSGVVGLVAFLCIAVYVIKRISRIVDTSRAWGGLLAMVGAFALAFLSVSGTFISFAPFWFVIASAVSYSGAKCCEKTSSVWRAL